MKINSPNKAKIIVELTRDDMLELDITYEDMDYSNIETRRVIWTLLDKARLELGRDIDPSGKLTIETIPLEKGGCVIFFTVNDKSLNLIKTIPAKEEVFEFDSIDNVIDLLSSLKDYSFSGDLYSDNRGNFRLITPFDERLHTRIKISEYSHPCREGKLAAEITKEHWHLKSSNFGIVTAD
ncbi:MAG: adaptor protein MecA [Clostridia bacterium]|nr:adaptor protein MecA [Clostridia bacterium]